MRILDPLDAYGYTYQSVVVTESYIQMNATYEVLLAGRKKRLLLLEIKNLKAMIVQVIYLIFHKLLHTEVYIRIYQKNFMEVYLQSVVNSFI